MGVFSEIYEKIEKLKKSKDEDTLMTARVLERAAKHYEETGNEEGAKNLLSGFRR